MKLRSARHTTDLKPIIHFYQECLGLDIIGEFHDHDDYNGVFFGKVGKDWHLEFTTSNEAPQHQADEDDLWVFFMETEQAYQETIMRFRENERQEVPPKNPYWKDHGLTFLDPDGFRIVIARPR